MNARHIADWDRRDADLEAAFREAEDKANELRDGVVVLVVEKVGGYVRNFACRTKDGATMASVMTDPPRRRR